jgi:hypothetical protein
MRARGWMTVPAPTEMGCVPWNVTDSATVAVLWAATGARGVGDGDVDDEGEARWCGLGGLRCVSGLAWLVLGSIVREDQLAQGVPCEFWREGFLAVVIDVIVVHIGKLLRSLGELRVFSALLLLRHGSPFSYRR